MTKKQSRIACFISLLLSLFISVTSRAQMPVYAPDENNRLLNEMIDISGDFRSFANTYYCADKLIDFDPAAGRGKIRYVRHEYTTRQAFDNMLGALSPVQANEFPSIE